MGFFDLFKPKNTMVDSNVMESISNIQSEQYHSNGNFEMVVEDVFSITGRGTVVTGKVCGSSISVGDEITILPSGIKTMVVGIESFRKMVDFAQVGDDVGLLLRGVSRDQITRGNKLVR